MIKIIEYTKADKTTSTRYIIELKPASDTVLALDVSEFSEEEQQVYLAEVTNAQEVFKETIRNIGLGSQYRFFKKEGIKYV